MLEGRAPANAGEVVLGTKTLESTGKDVGDIVTVQLGNRAVGMRVVGRGVFPEYGDASRLGNGAFMTFAGLQQVLPQAKANTFLLRFRPGSDAAAQVVRVRRALEPIPSRDSGRPRELEDLADVQDIPNLLTAILALLAGATLAHTLVTSVRRRRRDLAVLKTIGFTRGQVALAITWQATILVSLALAIGMPIGALAGRRVWDAFAEGLGAVPQTTLPTMAILITVPLAVLFANVIAAVPAWLAGRTKAAVALRAE
jgi:hypothetical protein